MKASTAVPDGDFSRVVLLTTDEDALSEFQQVLTPALETVSVGSLEEMAETLRQNPIDAAILDLDLIASNMNEAVARLQELRSASRDLVIVALTRSKSRAERLKAQEAGADEVQPSKMVLQTLKLVAVLNLFEVFESDDEAVQSFGYVA